MTTANFLTCAPAKQSESKRRPEAAAVSLIYLRFSPEMVRPFYLVFCIFAPCLVGQQAPKYALLGQTVSLDPFGIVISPDDILWKHKGDKVVEFNGNEQAEYGTYDNRITLDWHSAELSISDLRYEDSGEYVVEAYAKKELKRASFTLEVIDRVAKPTISCEMNNGNSSIKSGDQATLECSTEARQSPSLTKFEWSSHGTTQTGEKLIISLGDEHDDEVYDCTVSNPLTKESTTFAAKDCYPEGGSAGLTAGLCVAIIALILIILGVVFCKLKQKACFAKERGHDVEKPPGKTKGSENKAARDDERRGLIHRESTLASKQPLRFLTQQEINSQNNDTEDSDQDYRRESVRKRIEKFERHSGKKKAGLEKNEQIRAASPRPLDSAQNDKEDLDVHSVKELPEEERDPSGSKKSNDVSGDESENKKSDLQPSTASEQPGIEESKQTPAVTHHPLDSAENNKEDPDVHSSKELPGEERDPSDSEKSNDVSGDESENKKSDLQPPTAPDQPGSEEDKQIPAVAPGPDVESPKESAENKDRDPSDSEKSDVESGGRSEKAESDQQPPTASEQPVLESKQDAGDVSPPVSPLTQDSSNIAPQDGAGKQEKDSTSDQVTGGTTEISLDGSDVLNSTVENESNNHKDVKDNSTISEEKDPEATDEQNSQQDETRQGEDNQQESSNSGDNRDSDSANEREKIDQDKNLPPDPPQQPQSPITPKPDSSNTSTSPVPEHAVPDEKEKNKTRQNRGSDSSMEEADKGEAAEN